MSREAAAPLPAPVCPECHQEYSPGSVFCTNDATLLLGAVVDRRYRITRRIGGGAMGMVYGAEQLVVNYKRALKLLQPGLGGDGKLVARFVQEARALASIEHPNVVKLFDVGELPGGRVFLVMELLDGHDLRSELAGGWPAVKGGAVELESALHCFESIAEGLAAAHRQNIIHRDIKPENIQVSSGEGQGQGQGTDGPARVYKILDFGIAKRMDATQHLTTVAGAIGTPSYMSPEQCQGKELDARSDLYSLGVLMYEVVTGALPFEGEAAVVMYRQINANAPPPRARAPERCIPPSLEKVILKALKKKREARHASAEELLGALRAVRERLAEEARRGRAAKGSRKTLYLGGAIVGSALAIGAALALAWPPSPSKPLPTSTAIVPAEGEPAPSAAGSAREAEPVPPVLTELTAPIVVDTVPPGAEVIELDTKRVLGVTPKVSVSLNPGETRKLLIVKKGYFDDTIVVAPGRAMKPIHLDPRVEIETDPPGAELVDDQGKVIEGRFLRVPHPRKLLVHRDGYADEHLTVEPRPGQTVSVRLVPQVHVEVSPHEAQILDDSGILIGSAPQDVRVPPGGRKLILRCDRYWEQTVTLAATPGDSKQFTLDPLVVAQVDPPSAKLLDDQHHVLGAPPRSFHLPAGKKMKLLVMADDPNKYFDGELTLTSEPGRTFVAALSPKVFVLPDPARADVLDDRGRKMSSPVQVAVPRGGTRTVTVVASGYAPRRVTLRSEPGLRVPVELAPQVTVKTDPPDAVITDVNDRVLPKQIEVPRQGSVVINVKRDCFETLIQRLSPEPGRTVFVQLERQKSRVRIDVHPSFGAQILDAGTGRYLGMAPTEIEVGCGATLPVIVRQAGFLDKQVRLDGRQSKTVSVTLDAEIPH